MSRPLYFWSISPSPAAEFLLLPLDSVSLSLLPSLTRFASAPVRAAIVLLKQVVVVVVVCLFVCLVVPLEEPERLCSRLCTYCGGGGGCGESGGGGGGRRGQRIEVCTPASMTFTYRFNLERSVCTEDRPHKQACGKSLVGHTF